MEGAGPFSDQSEANRALESQRMVEANITRVKERLKTEKDKATRRSLQETLTSFEARRDALGRTAAASAPAKEGRTFLLSYVQLGADVASDKAVQQQVERVEPPGSAGHRVHPGSPHAGGWRRDVSGGHLQSWRHVMTVETPSTSSGGSPWPNRLILAVYFVCFSVGSLVHIARRRRSASSPMHPQAPRAHGVHRRQRAVHLPEPAHPELLIFKRRAGIVSALVVVGLVSPQPDADGLDVDGPGELYFAWLYLNGTMGLFMLFTAKRLWRAAPPEKALPAAPTPGTT